MFWSGFHGKMHSFFKKKIILVFCVILIVISSPDDDGKGGKRDNCSWLRQPISLTAKENLNTDLYASWTIPNNFHYLIWKHRCVFMYILCCIAIYQSYPHKVDTLNYICKFYFFKRIKNTCPHFYSITNFWKLFGMTRLAFILLQ